MPPPPWRPVHRQRHESATDRPELWTSAAIDRRCGQDGAVKLGQGAGSQQAAGTLRT
jgi:hypothetical protein